MSAQALTTVEQSCPTPSLLAHLTHKIIDVCWGDMLCAAKTIDCRLLERSAWSAVLHPFLGRAVQIASVLVGYGVWFPAILLEEGGRLRRLCA